MVDWEDEMKIALTKTWSCRACPASSGQSCSPSAGTNFASSLRPPCWTSSICFNLKLSNETLPSGSVYQSFNTFVQNFSNLTTRLLEVSFLDLFPHQICVRTNNLLCVSSSRRCSVFWEARWLGLQMAEDEEEDRNAPGHQVGAQPQSLLILLAQIWTGRWLKAYGRKRYIGEYLQTSLPKARCFWPSGSMIVSPYYY